MGWAFIQEYLYFGVRALFISLSILYPIGPKSSHAFDHNDDNEAAKTMNMRAHVYIYICPDASSLAKNRLNRTSELWLLRESLFYAIHNYQLRFNVVRLISLFFVFTYIIIILFTYTCVPILHIRRARVSKRVLELQYNRYVQ